ncbi:MAG TPA: hypothetical protein VF521_08255 [Pyrinomonadaceae bacterium]|jgi:hypothetical protein
MRNHFVAPSLLLAAALLSACGNANGPVAARNSNAAAGNNSQTSIQHGERPASNLGPAAAHGGANAGGPASNTPPVATPELDAKVEKAEAKAKAAGASEADKKSAASAYFERADFFRDQGDPRLYRFALRDYRIGLRYDPSAKEPRAKMDEIVRIYESMGRPVPDLGNEPQ